MTSKKLFLFIPILLVIYSCNGDRTNSNEYNVVHGWPRLPDGFVLGQVAGVEVDSHGHVFVFHRSDRVWLTEIPSNPILGKTILSIDSETGEILSAWGDSMFVIPHGLSIDKEDNIWVTDVGLHQVFKFSHDGELLLTVGEKRVPGLDGQHFNGPTDVAITTEGEFYVSDGYGNSRIAKFTADGQFLFDWGKKGNKVGEFDTPHGTALGSNGFIYIADRGNSRIQVFDANGSFIAAWKSPELGRPWGLAVGLVRQVSQGIGKDNYIYVVDGGDLEQSLKPRSHVLKLDLNGNLISKWSSYGKYDGQLVWAHDVGVGRDGSVYVGDVYYGMRIQKFRR